MTNPTSNFGWQMPTPTDLVTDLPADFEVFGQAVDTSLADLKGGTTGQVLAKASNTDMDFVWSADAAGMTNPMTTTGDTIYSSSGSTPARLGIGSTGNVLTVAGGVPTWAAPSSPAVSYTLLSTTTTNTGTSFNITGLSGYNNLLITFQNVTTTDTGNNQMYLRPNNNTTAANYEQLGWSMTPPSTMTNVVIAEAGIKVANQGTTTGKNICGYIYLFGANSSGRKMITQATAIANGTGGLGFIGGGNYTDANVISNVTLITLGGNFSGGTMRIFGAN